MGGKSAPSTPDYTPIAQADEQAANQSFQLQSQEFDWAKSQAAQEDPYENAYLAQQTSNSAQESQIAQEENNQYQSTYVPIENQFAKEAQEYNSADNADQLAGEATADVANNYSAANKSAQQNLESYGIDPSQTRFAALDLGTSINQAAATAAAGTQSRQNTFNTGMSLEQNAINTGMGIESGAIGAYGGAASSGSAGFGSYNQSLGAQSSAQTGATAFGNEGISANSGATSALNDQFNNGLAGAQLNYQETQGMIGDATSLIGGAMGMF